MSTIYRVRAAKDLTPDNPLHVGYFYPNIDRRHRRKMQDRQDLILYLAQLHSAAISNCLSSGTPRGFCYVKLRLMTLRDWVHDYRVVLDHFFEVVKTGFNFGADNHEVSTLIPRDIGTKALDGGRELELSYLPPERQDGVVSKVYVQKQNADAIRRRLAEENRADLVSPCEWLLAQNEINFIFKPAGKLQQRDTSIWPIAAIETWPSWLREALFGGGIDIDSAYTQYLVQELRASRSDTQLKLIYPDLIKSLDDKAEWRRSICEDVLGLPVTDNNISTVKRICMSLANGSRISPAILGGGGGFSVTADIVIQAADDLSVARLDKIGTKLQSISRQYSHAKQAVCTTSLRLNPSRANQKRVFGSYFEWERVARYLIWDEVDHHGIMMHDGIDGIPECYLQNVPAIIQKIGLKVTT